MRAEDCVYSSQSRRNSVAREKEDSVMCLCLSRELITTRSAVECFATNNGGKERWRERRFDQHHRHSPEHANL